MDNTSNSSNQSNLSATHFTDKPDELVSSGNVQSPDQSIQLQSSPLQTPPQITPNQKKCLHQRIFHSNIIGSSANTNSHANTGHGNGVASNGSLSNERLTALMQLQNMSTVGQSIGQATPLSSQQQRSLSLQTALLQRFPPHILRNATSGVPITPTSTTSGQTNGNKTTSANVTTISPNTVPIIPNQNGLVQPMSAALLADRYLLMDLVEGSTLYKCLDVKTHEELVCKVILLILFIVSIEVSAISFDKINFAFVLRKYSIIRE